MNFEEMLALVSNEPVFSSALLLAGREDVQRVRLQLSRWVKGGKIYQVRRGLYALAPPWQKVEPHPFLVANRLRRGSYVSLQSALAWHGLIPEYTPVVTSVGAGRPTVTSNPLGSFVFKHLMPELRFGYLKTVVTKEQSAFVATPEKALLDLLYLTPKADSVAFIDELRLQNLSVLDRELLIEMANRANKTKLLRCVKIIEKLLDDQGDIEV